MPPFRAEVCLRLQDGGGRRSGRGGREARGRPYRAGANGAFFCLVGHTGLLPFPNAQALFERSHAGAHGHRGMSLEIVFEVVCHVGFFLPRYGFGLEDGGEGLFALPAGGAGRDWLDQYRLVHPM